MAKQIDLTTEDYTMLQPTGDRILVKRDKGEEKTDAGIHVIGLTVGQLAMVER